MPWLHKKDLAKNKRAVRRHTGSGRRRDAVDIHKNRLPDIPDLADVDPPASSQVLKRIEAFPSGGFPSGGFPAIAIDDPVGLPDKQDGSRARVPAVADLYTDGTGGGSAVQDMQEEGSYVYKDDWSMLNTIMWDGEAYSSMMVKIMAAKSNERPVERPIHTYRKSKAYLRGVPSSKLYLGQIVSTEKNAIAIETAIRRFIAPHAQTPERVIPVYDFAEVPQRVLGIIVEFSSAPSAAQALAAFRKFQSTGPLLPGPVTWSHADYASLPASGSDRALRALDKAADADASQRAESPQRGAQRPPENPRAGDDAAAAPGRSGRPPVSLFTRSPLNFAALDRTGEKLEEDEVRSLSARLHNATFLTPCSQTMQRYDRERRLKPRQDSV